MSVNFNTASGGTAYAALSEDQPVNPDTPPQAPAAKPAGSPVGSDDLTAGGTTLLAARPPSTTYRLNVRDTNDGTAISGNDIKQGALGDCYFLSSMMSMADSPGGRSWLANHMKDNNDGTYTVSFPQSTFFPARNVTVTREEALNSPVGFGDSKTVNGQTQQEIWPKVMEAAYRKHIGLDATVGEALNAGGISNYAFDVLTGNGGNLTLTSTTSSRDLQATIYRSLSNGEAITAGTNLWQGDLGKNFGVIAGHQYQISGLEERNGMTFVELRNPHGRNHLSLPIEVFKETFAGISTMPLR